LHHVICRGIERRSKGIGGAPGTLHHVIERGINRQRIFLDDPDKKNFLDRLSALLKGSGIKCYAWVVRDNHFHLLLRSGAVSAHFNISVNSVRKSMARGRTLAKQHDNFLPDNKG
jgi:REP element-mobilizing transposase RayT